MWLRECPDDHQGLVRPMVTESGRVILFCDDVGEVWLDPVEAARDSRLHPWSPTWHVVDDVHVRPGTTRWAERADLPPEWSACTWHDD
ncbi:hypothetical protein HGA02_05780 [Cellulomonas septica]|uniref:Uncharacterized protein n=1 Tax=Cellulomonas septica TaxID=285080 RepID=A0ABX1JYT3_9CELL|nr:hypothetical protein [Cellulomonas septica]